jgi:hypothetical protein
MRPLPIPPDAEQDPEALEMLRGWVIQGQLQLSLAAWVWRESPETWGQLLAEAAGHIADAVATETGVARPLVFGKIAESLRYHLEYPADDLEGHFLKEP